MPKFLGLFSKRGLTTFLASCFFTTAGAGATFLPLAFFPFGCKQETHSDFFRLQNSRAWKNYQPTSEMHLLSQASHQPRGLPCSPCSPKERERKSFALHYKVYKSPLEGNGLKRWLHPRAAEIPPRRVTATGTRPTPRTPRGLAGLPEPAAAAGAGPGRAGPYAAFPHHRKSSTKHRSIASPGSQAPSRCCRGPSAAADDGGRPQMAADCPAPPHAAAITHHLGRWEKEAERCMPGGIYSARDLARARGAGPGP